MVPAWVLEDPLGTPRTLLRPHRLEDLDDLVEFHSDPEVTAFIPWPVRDRAATLTALEAKLGQDRAEREGDWIVLAIEHRESGRVIGEVLLKRGPEGSGVAEVGYVVARRFQGQGLGSEVVRAVLEIAVGRFGVRLVEAVVDERNTASQRLLEHLGFTREPRSGVPEGCSVWVRRMDGEQGT